MKKRTFAYLGGLVLAFIICLFCLPARAEASYKATFNSDGTVNVTVKETGAFVAKLEVPGERVASGITVTDANVFFLSYQVGQYRNTYSLQKVSRTTGKRTRMKKLSTAYYSYHIRAVYDGSLYMEAQNPGDIGVALRYKVKEKKLLKIAKGGWAFGYKYRFVADGTMNSGMQSPGYVYIYNTKSGKRTTLAANVLGTTYTGQYAFVASMKNPDSLPAYHVNVYKIIGYNLANANKKVLATAMRGYKVDKITTKFVYHHGEVSGNTVYYRYNLSTKKNTKISKAAYEAALA